MWKLNGNFEDNTWWRKVNWVAFAWTISTVAFFPLYHPSSLIGDRVFEHCSFPVRWQRIESWWRQNLSAAFQCIARVTLNLNENRFPEPQRQNCVCSNWKKQRDDNPSLKIWKQLMLDLIAGSTFNWLRFYFWYLRNIINYKWCIKNIVYLRNLIITVGNNHIERTNDE